MSDYIPKIVHYCWFGNKTLPQLEEKCIQSWQRNLPGYKFYFWNESNFEYEKFRFSREAYKAGKFAFVADFARLYVLYHYGGIYLDTDIEIIRPFDEFLLSRQAFIGIENNRGDIAGSLIGVRPKDEFIFEILKYYNKPFDGTTITLILTDYFLEKGYKKENIFQEVGHFSVFPREYFHPKRLADDLFLISSKTYTIHHCSGSWLTEQQKKRGESVLWRKVARPTLRLTRDFLNTIIGKRITKDIEVWLRKKLK